MDMRFRPGILSLAVVFLVSTGCEEIKNFVMGDAVDLAKKRVTLVLEGSVGGQEDQRAISQYYKGVDLITGPELEAAYDDFVRWMKAKGIHGKIKTWEIVGAEQLEKEGAEATTVVVSVKVNGRNLKMRVPHRQPITWAK